MQLIQLSAQFRKLTHLTDSLLLKTLYITDELNFYYGNNQTEFLIKLIVTSIHRSPADFSYNL